MDKTYRYYPFDSNPGNKLNILDRTFRFGTCCWISYFSHDLNRWDPLHSSRQSMDTWQTTLGIYCHPSNAQARASTPCVPLFPSPQRCRSRHRWEWGILRNSNFFFPRWYRPRIQLYPCNRWEFCTWDVRKLCCGCLECKAEGTWDQLMCRSPYTSICLCYFEIVLEDNWRRRRVLANISPVHISYISKIRSYSTSTFHRRKASNKSWLNLEQIFQKCIFCIFSNQFRPGTVLSNTGGKKHCLLY